METVKYNGYNGKRLFAVAHPDYKYDRHVYAPNEQAAIAAAGKAWDRRWQDYEFHAYCEVREIK